MRPKIAHAVLIALLGASAYLSVALLLTSPASAATSPCSDSVMSAPTGPATVSAAWTPGYGRVLVVGSGPYQGCSLYLLTSDQLHALTGAPYACSDNPNVKKSLATPSCGRRSSPRALRSRGRGSTPGCSGRSPAPTCPAWGRCSR